MNYTVNNKEQYLYPDHFLPRLACWKRQTLLWRRQFLPRLVGGKWKEEIGSRRPDQLLQGLVGGQWKEVSSRAYADDRRGNQGQHGFAAQLSQLSTAGSGGLIKGLSKSLLSLIQLNLDFIESRFY